MAITFILLFIFADWLTGLFLSMMGIILAGRNYWLLIGSIHLSLAFYTPYLLLYQIVFGLLKGFKILLYKINSLPEIMNVTNPHTHVYI